MTALEHEHPVDPARVGKAKAALTSAEEAAQLAGLLGLLSDPVRSRILMALGASERLSVGDLALALESERGRSFVCTEAVADRRPGDLPEGRPDRLLSA